MLYELNKAKRQDELKNLFMKNIRKQQNLMLYLSEVKVSIYHRDITTFV